MNGYSLAALLALALLLPTAWGTNHDTETDQAIADTVIDVAGDARQLHADMLFAEARP